MVDLEKEKLLLEISKLKLPWYKNLEFWKIFIPTIAVIASLYFTFGQGVLDIRKEKLELQKEQLKLEILQFEQTKASIQKSIIRSSKALDSLNTIVELYKKKSAELSNDIKIYENRISGYENNINQLSGSLVKDKKYYQDILLNQFAVEKKHFLEIQSLKESYATVYDTLLAIQIENKYLRNKVKLDKMEMNDLEILKRDSFIHQNEKRLQEIEKMKKRIENEYQKEKNSIGALSLDELIKKYELLKLKMLSK